jgi:hypothetical protein
MSAPRAKTEFAAVIVFPPVQTRSGGLAVGVSAVLSKDTNPQIKPEFDALSPPTI